MKFKWHAFKIAGICIVVFLLQIFINGFTELFLLDSSRVLEAWRFLTAIFLHGSFVHLLYNMFALVLFGSILERIIGGKRFLFVFFATGVLANVFSVFFYPSSLGASGAIFGIIGSLVIVRPLLVVWAFGLPMPIFVAGILWAAGDLIGAIGFLSGAPIDNTGNLAHLSGMFFGLLLGAFYRNWKSQGIRRNRVYLEESQVRDWEDSYLR